MNMQIQGCEMQAARLMQDKQHACLSFLLSFCFYSWGLSQSVGRWWISPPPPCMAAISNPLVLDLFNANPRLD